MTLSASAVGSRSTPATGRNTAAEIASLQKQITGLMKQMKGLQKQLVGMQEGDAKEAVKIQLEAITRQIALSQQQIQSLQSERAGPVGVVNALQKPHKTSLRIATLSGGTVNTEA